jgi:hypothetical protein
LARGFRYLHVGCHKIIFLSLKRYIAILNLLICSYANGQDTELFKRIDSIVTDVDYTALKGTFDTLKGGLLNERGTTSDIFILKQGRLVQKIFVINKSKDYSEKIVFQNGRPVFAQFTQSNGEKWTFYLVGEDAYFKDGNKLNKGNGSYWYSMIDFYLSLFNDQMDK